MQGDTRSGAMVHDLSHVDQALLPIVRHFLNAFVEPHSMGWRIALTASVERWGEARGLAIAHATQTFLSAVLLSRSGPVDYTDPLDIDQRHRVTFDEMSILNVISAMSMDQTARARELLHGLVGDKLPAHLVAAGLCLARLFGESAPHRQAQTAPRLTLINTSCA